MNDLPKLDVLPDAPICLYQQGNNGTCVTSCLASALHYVGYEETVRQIDYFGQEQIETFGAIYPKAHNMLQKI